MEHVMGFFLALLSSAAFGLIPLFSLPLMQGGMSAGCVLFYRFLFGSLALGLIVVLRRERLAAPLRIHAQADGRAARTDGQAPRGTPRRRGPPA